MTVQTIEAEILAQSQRIEAAKAQLKTEEARLGDLEYDLWRAKMEAAHPGWERELQKAMREGWASDARVSDQRIASKLLWGSVRNLERIYKGDWRRAEADMSAWLDRETRACKAEGYDTADEFWR